MKRHLSKTMFFTIQSPPEEEFQLPLEGFLIPFSGIFDFL